MARILLIEDMAGIRRAVSAMLGRGGHTVVAATQGAEGLAALRSQCFDLVVTDVVIQELDGAAVLSAISTMPARPKVIAMSGAGAGITIEGALRAARLKADAFLGKPFEQDILLDTVDTLLAKAA